MSKSSDQEKFISSLAKHGGMLRGYIRNGVRAPQDVDELMQRVSLIAWKKIDQLDDWDNFPKWAATIARYEMLSFRREKARDRLQFNDDVWDKLVSESVVEDLQFRERRIRYLEECLKELPEYKRALLEKAYNGETSMKDLAKESNRSPESIYKMMSRLRFTLLLCIERKLERRTQR